MGVLGNRTIFIAELNNSIKETFRSAIMQAALPGFQDGVHGIVANDADHMAAASCKLPNSEHDR